MEDLFTAGRKARVASDSLNGSKALVRKHFEHVGAALFLSPRRRSIHFRNFFLRSSSSTHFAFFFDSGGGQALV